VRRTGQIGVATNLYSVAYLIEAFLVLLLYLIDSKVGEIASAVLLFTRKHMGGGGSKIAFTGL
jgi:hypothetical protein